MIVDWLMANLRIEGWISLIIIIVFGTMLLLSYKAGGISRESFGAMLMLKAGMFLTAILIFGLSVLILQMVLNMFGFGFENLILIVAMFTAFFMIFQWLFAPSFINTFYKVKFIEHPSNSMERWLLEKVEYLTKLSGLKRVPKVGIAMGLNIPNAFAYSSPIYGPHVAVTPSLLSNMPKEEVEAVLAHEIGHLKHRDVTAMLAVSFIPILIYYLGRHLMFMSAFGYGYSGRDRDQTPALLLLVGIVLVLAGIIFQFLVKHFNRLREYYADAHSANTLNNPRPLQRALARLDLMYKAFKGRMKQRTDNNFISMLFIYNYFVDFFYDYDEIDSYVEELKNKKTSWLIELLSTHPPIPKRIRFLDKLKLQ